MNTVSKTIVRLVRARRFAAVLGITVLSILATACGGENERTGPSLSQQATAQEKAALDRAVQLATDANEATLRGERVPRAAQQ
jgi:hypothetical protein